MNMQKQTWIGVDPGGENAFGLAILPSSGRVRTWVCSCTDEAIHLLIDNLGETPAGVGVDAPLWWSSGVGGGRFADQWIRDKYGLSGGNVQSVNSLRGAATIQGALFIDRIRRHFPNIPATESHPKAIMVALKHITWEEYPVKFGFSLPVGNHQEHERDAIICAISAREGFEGRWIKDLTMERNQSEQDPRNHWLAPIHYFWPET